MFSGIKKILGIGAATDFAQLVKAGAVIIDVRSRSEFDGGNINGSVNIPLDQLQNNLAKLKNKNQAIITCCASGMRSAAAKALLKSNGYLFVYNGGGWSRLQNKL